MTVEYRIKAITRYIVTRHEQSERATTGRTRQIGSEYDNAEIAYEVGYALARQEAEQMGYGPGDMRLIYPRHPQDPNANPALGVGAAALTAAEAALAA